MRIFIICILLSISAVSSAYAQKVSKAEWISAMKTALPAYFCQDAQYFRECFTVDIIECENVASSVTRLCLNELESKIPETLNQPNDGRVWGTKIGMCAGTTYETTLIKKRISGEKCNNISNWQ